jgi:hypothetical protein
VSRPASQYSTLSTVSTIRTRGAPRSAGAACFDRHSSPNAAMQRNASVAGLLGAEVPRPWVPGSPWRVFFTARHGDDDTWELIHN